MFSTSALLCAALGLAACTADSYAGIPLRAGAAEPELQALARRAQAGDKQAQLELGIRYEEGRGVPVDRARAARLYRAAARESGGTRLVYVPSSRPGQRGATVPLGAGPRQRGNDEARIRLARLEATETARRSSRFTTRAVIANVTEIDATHHCPPPTGTAECNVYLLSLAEATPPAPCPFIAVNYWNDNGHRYQIWPETLIHSRGRRWTLVGERIAAPTCFIALINAH